MPSCGQHLGDLPRVGHDVDRTGLAGRELLLQAPQALDRLGRVAELLAEVERAAVVEVAERAGDQDHEHADGERERLAPGRAGRSAATASTSCAAWGTRGGRAWPSSRAAA